MNRKLNLSGGALIIGSRLWQPNSGGSDNTIRKGWRDNRLNLRSRTKVKTPIRCYGRFFNGVVYTMTFPISCKHKPGIAFAVLFRQKPINSAEELQVEAMELSRAEGMRRKFMEANGDGIWGVLGILFNEDRIDPSKKEWLQSWWKQKIEAEPLYPDFNYLDFRLSKKQPCILQGGSLNIPWPKVVNTRFENRLANLDFLLATATRPTGIKYPSVTTMVKNVRDDKGRKYFRKNNRKGIITHQDPHILKKLI